MGGVDVARFRSCNRWIHSQSHFDIGHSAMSSVWSNLHIHSNFRSYCTWNHPFYSFNDSVDRYICINWTECLRNAVTKFSWSSLSSMLPTPRCEFKVRYLDHTFRSFFVTFEIIESNDWKTSSWGHNCSLKCNLVVQKSVRCIMNRLSLIFSFYVS